MIKMRASPSSFFNRISTAFVVPENLQWPLNQIDSNQEIAGISNNQNTLLSAEINSFRILIVSRLNYLDSLKEIGDDWISGSKSFRPSDEVINNIKLILEGFYSWISSTSEGAYFPPGIVMGPIPEGGIIVEFKVSEKSTIYLSLYNENEDSGIELEEDGMFTEVSSEISDYPGKLIQLFKEYSNKYAYTE